MSKTVPLLLTVPAKLKRVPSPPLHGVDQIEKAGLAHQPS